MIHFKFKIDRVLKDSNLFITKNSVIEDLNGNAIYTMYLGTSYNDVKFMIVKEENTNHFKIYPMFDYDYNLDLNIICKVFSDDSKDSEVEEYLDDIMKNEKQEWRKPKWNIS